MITVRGYSSRMLSPINKPFDTFFTSMLVQNNKIKAGKAEIGLTDNGLILIRVHENKEINVADIREINKIKNELADNKPYSVIFVAPLFGNITNEARELCASKEVYHNAVAKAIVVKNLASRLIGSFFIRINKPPAPTRMCATEEEAAEWLKEVTKSHFQKTEAIKTDSL